MSIDFCYKLLFKKAYSRIALWDMCGGPIIFAHGYVEGYCPVYLLFSVAFQYSTNNMLLHYTT